MHFFHEQKQKIEVKKFQSLFGCKLAFVQKYVLYKKEFLHAKIDFLVFKT